MQSFLKENGYVWDSGVSGHYTYGPQGTALKKSIENRLRQAFDANDFSEISTPLLLHKDVWVRSGHWDKFRDPVVYTKAKKMLRLDHLIEESCTEEFTSLSFERICEILTEYNQQAEDPVVIPEQMLYRDLMMRCQSGNQDVGLRPETATATYNNFQELFIFYNKQFPIRVYQIGKSFRNEINPRNGVIRGREFTQAEFQVILPVEQKSAREFDYSRLLAIPITGRSLEIDEWRELPSEYAYYILFTYNLFRKLGIPYERIRIRRHAEDERAFYALDAWDIEVDLTGLGWTEIAGIHDRGAYDLRHSKFKKAIPHIIEIAIGVDRLFYSILDTLYDNKTEQEGKTILKIPYSIAPITVAVYPVVRTNQKIVEVAQDIYGKLKVVFNTEYNEKQSIGRRYLKAAIKGIPLCITVDTQTLEDDTVTIRDRNTENQDRVKVGELINEILLRKMSWT